MRFRKHDADSPQRPSLCNKTCLAAAHNQGKALLAPQLTAWVQGAAGNETVQLSTATSQRTVRRTRRKNWQRFKLVQPKTVRNDKK